MKTKEQIKNLISAFEKEKVLLQNQWKENKKCCDISEQNNIIYNIRSLSDKIHVLYWVLNGE